MAKSSEPKQTILEGVFPRSAAVHNADKRYATVEFTASWTDEIREEMGWPSKVSDKMGAVDLLGTLSVSQCVLMPEVNGVKVSAHAETLPCTELTGFNLVPLKDKSGEVLGRELRFTMRTNMLAVPGRIGRYINNLGRAPASLICTHAEPGESRQMAIGEDGGDDKQEPLPLKGEAAAKHEETQKGRKSKVN